MNPPVSRRTFLAQTLTAAACGAALPSALAAGKGSFRLNYIIASSMYGELPLSEILPDVRKAGADSIDIWPRKHGNQREQMEEMGHDKFAAMLKQHNVKLGMFTRYDLGPFGLQPELKVAKKFGARIIVTGASGPKDLKGPELKKAVGDFVEKLKPHVAAAEEAGVIIAIENHGSNLIDSPDSIRWLGELSSSPHLGVALAPYHLPDDAEQQAALIRDLGDKLAHFYAWQHGHGCMTKLPKEEEVLQMPGRGKIDFTVTIKALKDINYTGWTSIFMHPTPRGIPILPTAREVTAEINRARYYLEACAKKA